MHPSSTLRILFVVTVATTGSVNLSGCTKQAEAEVPPKAVEVGFVNLSAQPVTLTSQLTGRTVASTAADVRPQVDGIIKDRLFTEGAIVKAGDPLYQIDPRVYQAALDTAQAQLENAKAILVTDQAKADRYRRLGQSQAVSGQDLDDAISAARAAEANVHLYDASVQTARLNLEFTKVLAPITGRIGRSSVTSGALVTAGQTTALANIQQLDPIYVDITQSATALLKTRQAIAQGTMTSAGSAVTIAFEDGTAYPTAGKVEFSEEDVDEAAGTVTLRARFANPDGILLPGMFVRANVPQGVVPMGILAPQQSVMRDAKGDATALIVNTENKIEQRSVAATEAIGDKWLITRGLDRGDRLVVEGTAKVKSGTVVTPTEMTVD
ncbi:efflux RND transporter periplasmic adaptor subunit [Rhizobium sp. 18055]|uniref:efflux RND transporter periplasmic adaptor subunit n=1 Tax=Rhizobium sp. 18055 TaxID=2681403 RepID=UPI00135B049D|nr:efflux RND transporter periplasmic adaptor subunit [Rhizobium sp. 18055]